MKPRFSATLLPPSPSSSTSPAPFTAGPPRARVPRSVAQTINLNDHYSSEEGRMYCIYCDRNQPGRKLGQFTFTRGITKRAKEHIYHKHMRRNGFEDGNEFKRLHAQHSRSQISPPLIPLPHTEWIRNEEAIPTAFECPSVQQTAQGDDSPLETSNVTRGFHNGTTSFKIKVWPTPPWTPVRPDKPTFDTSDVMLPEEVTSTPSELIGASLFPSSVTWKAAPLSTSIPAYAFDSSLPFEQQSAL
ncbi:hypothetical protein P7C70_g462, partial [Phenoliferia sp. Uapishka_3]